MWQNSACSETAPAPSSLSTGASCSRCTNFQKSQKQPKQPVFTTFTPPARQRSKLHRPQQLHHIRTVHALTAALKPRSATTSTPLQIAIYPKTAKNGYFRETRWPMLHFRGGQSCAYSATMGQVQRTAQNTSPKLQPLATTNFTNFPPKHSQNISDHHRTTTSTFRRSRATRSRAVNQRASIGLKAAPHRPQHCGCGEVHNPWLLHRLAAQERAVLRLSPKPPNWTLVEVCQLAPLCRLRRHHPV